MKKENELLVRIGRSRTVQEAVGYFTELAECMRYTANPPKIDLNRVKDIALKAVVFDDEEEISKDAFLNVAVALGLDSEELPNELPTDEDEDLINETLETNC